MWSGCVCLARTGDTEIFVLCRYSCSQHSSVREQAYHKEQVSPHRFVQLYTNRHEDMDYNMCTEQASNFEQGVLKRPYAEIDKISPKKKPLDLSHHDNQEQFCSAKGLTENLYNSAIDGGDCGTKPKNSNHDTFQCIQPDESVVAIEETNDYNIHPQEANEGDNIPNSHAGVITSHHYFLKKKSGTIPGIRNAQDLSDTWETNEADVDFWSSDILPETIIPEPPSEPEHSVPVSIPGSQSYSEFVGDATHSQGLGRTSGQELIQEAAADVCYTSDVSQPVQVCKYM